jgi:hypothetical protein
MKQSAATFALALAALACGRGPDVPATAAPAQEELPTCALPGWRPTYLPWLPAGEAIPEPDEESTTAGGGPQGTDPGYSTLVWGFGDVTTRGGPRLKGTLALWRSTENVGASPADPDVPPLPDGAEGRFFEGEGNDWSIVWADVSHGAKDACDETVLLLDMPNLSSEQVRTELTMVARSLVRV